MSQHHYSSMFVRNRIKTHRIEGEGINYTLPSYLSVLLNDVLKKVLIKNLRFHWFRYIMKIWMLWLWLMLYLENS